ncbi:MAG: hypothetical protein Q8M92_07630 [Candidatus Subteraquimicrobiales bacterium]|nr:hypothetical protein [Candidatus Subteraquimicrobiales bacterium]
MDLAKISNRIREEFDRKDQAREAALGYARQTIRSASNAVRAIHAGEYSKAGELLANTRQTLDKCDELLESYPDIYYAGFVQDAQKEYVEAMATLVLICREGIPDPDEIRVGYSPYLNGLGEAIGELRRHILDIIREGKAEQGEELLKIMDDIYYTLVSFDYPDAITPGLRRITDIARSVMERTRGDLTTSIRQNELRRAIEQRKEIRKE